MKWLAMVQIEAETLEQARIVLRERVGYDEVLNADDGTGPFDYQITVVEWPVEKV